VRRKALRLAKRGSSTVSHPNRAKQMIEKLFDQWKLAVVSLVLATLLWIYANRHITREEILTMPVSLTAPADIRVETPLSEIKVKIAGPSGLIDALKEREAALEVRYHLDPNALGTQSSLTETLFLTRDDLPLPKEAEVLSITPESFRVKLTRFAEKTLPVKPNIIGKPAPGYEIAEEVRVEPKEVLVRGPKDVLDQIEAVPTEPVSVEGIRTSYTRTGVRLAEHIGQALIETDRTVDIRIDVRRVWSSRRFEGLSVRALIPQEFPYTIRLSEKRDITVKGPQEVVAQLKPEDIRLFVDVSGLIPSNEPYRSKVLSALPEGLVIEEDLGNATFEIIGRQTMPEKRKVEEER